MFNETARSFFVSVSCLALLLSLLSGLCRVHGLRVSDSFGFVVTFRSTRSTNLVFFSVKIISSNVRS